AGADLGVDHENGTGLPTADAVHRILNTEGGRRARHVHVETEAFDAQRCLHFHGDRRVGPLQFGTGDDHPINVGSRAACTLQRLLRRLHRHLTEDRPLLVAALGYAWHHAIDIEDADLVRGETAPDAGSLINELAVGQWSRFHLTGLDVLRVLRVEAFCRGIETGDHFVNADVVRR